MCTFCVHLCSLAAKVICRVSSVPSGCLKRGLGVPWASPGLLLAPGVLEARLRVAQHEPGPYAYAWPYVREPLSTRRDGPGLGRCVAARGVRPLMLSEHVVSLPVLNHFSRRLIHQGAMGGPTGSEMGGPRAPPAGELVCARRVDQRRRPATQVVCSARRGWGLACCTRNIRSDPAACHVLVAPRPVGSVAPGQREHPPVRAPVAGAWCGGAAASRPLERAGGQLHAWRCCQHLARVGHCGTHVDAGADRGSDAAPAGDDGSHPEHIAGGQTPNIREE